MANPTVVQQRADVLRRERVNLKVHTRDEPKEGFVRGSRKQLMPIKALVRRFC